MKLGVYQFASTEDIEKNLTTILKAIKLAAENKLRIIVFHECALCGYPPIESNIENICKEKIEVALTEISKAAKQYKIYVAVGTVRHEIKERFNSIVVFNDNGIQVENYDKVALWGWDTDNFIRGKNIGIIEIDDIKIGFRICFDVRFPESFRELYKNKVDLCFVSFSDTSNEENSVRYNIIKSHLITRAVENIMTIVSVNTTSNCQTAPTAVFDHNGIMLKEAKLNNEELLIFDYIKPDINFSTKGKIVNNDYFINNNCTSKVDLS